MRKIAPIKSKNLEIFQEINGDFCLTSDEEIRNITLRAKNFSCELESLIQSVHDC